MVSHLNCNNILNFQESTTILNAHTKKVWKLIVCTSYTYIYIYTYPQTIFGPGNADVYAYRNMRVRNQKRHERVKLCMLEGKKVVYGYRPQCSKDGGLSFNFRWPYALPLSTSRNTYSLAHKYIFSSYNVGKHVRYPAFISCQPGS